MCFAMVCRRERAVECCWDGDDGEEERRGEMDAILNVFQPGLPGLLSPLHTVIWCIFILFIIFCPSPKRTLLQH